MFQDCFKSLLALNNQNNGPFSWKSSYKCVITSFELLINKEYYKGLISISWQRGLSLVAFIGYILFYWFLWLIEHHFCTKRFARLLYLRLFQVRSSIVCGEVQLWKSPFVEGEHLLIFFLSDLLVTYLRRTLHFSLMVSIWCWSSK